MAPYHKLIVMISSVIPENWVPLTKSEQFDPKSAHIRPTISHLKKLINSVNYKTVRRKFTHD